ncbi:MAG: lysophospholipid acyltransferase family protein [Desulfatiglandales bacterium]
MHTIRFLARPLLSLFFSLETKGLEDLPSDSAYILLPKHQRWEDIPLLALAVPRPLYYMAKQELFMLPVAGWFMASMGGVPVHRTRPISTRDSLRAMAAYLEKGEGIVIFPEGTYYRNALGPGHLGLVRRVHSRFDVPFVPAGITYRVGYRRTSVRIHIGKPLNGRDFSSAWELLDRVMSEIGRLSGLERPDGSDGGVGG